MAYLIFSFRADLCHRLVHSPDQENRIVTEPAIAALVGDNLSLTHAFSQIYSPLRPGESDDTSEACGPRAWMRSQQGEQDFSAVCVRTAWSSQTSRPQSWGTFERIDLETCVVTDCPDLKVFGEYPRFQACVLRIGLPDLVNPYLGLQLNYIDDFYT
jgi:hypothetical protein